jgi:hypothetical protein
MIAGYLHKGVPRQADERKFTINLRQQAIDKATSEPELLGSCFNPT